MTLRVRILAYDGVEALDFAGPFEVFTTASRVGQRMNAGTPAPFEVASVALARSGQPVQARAGLRLLADHDLATSPEAEVLIVPGGVVDAPIAAGRALAERTARQMDYAWNSGSSNPSA